MNKQEAIEKIKNISTLKINDTVTHHQIDMVIKNQVLDIISQIDELQKVVVPQFVADWYEENKDNFEYSVQCLCVHCPDQVRQIDIWFDGDDTNPIETLVKMKLFGYEIEKEKLYKISLKKSGIGIGIQQQDGSFKEQFTKDELKEHGLDNLDEYEIEEVKE